MRLELRDLGRDLDRHRLQRDAGGHGIADLGRHLGGLIRGSAIFMSLMMISLMMCRCSIVRLTVSAAFTTGAVRGTCASTGRTSVRTAAVMPTNIAADIRLCWDMRASAWSNTGPNITPAVPQGSPHRNAKGAAEAALFA